MKKKFSVSWKSSRQKRKQRKYLANAPLHLRQKQLSSSLNKELKKKYNRKSINLRKGDSVRVLSGKFRGKTGKVSILNLKKFRVSIEGVQIQKKEGTKVNITFHPSKLQIQELNLDDKRRLEKLNKKQKENKNAPEKK